MIPDFTKYIANFISLLEKTNQETADLNKNIEALVDKNINDEILDFNQAKDYLKISKTTMLNLERTGEITPARIGDKGLKRYVKADLLAFVKRKS